MYDEIFRLRSLSHLRITYSSEFLVIHHYKTLSQFNDVEGDVIDVVSFASLHECGAAHLALP